MSTNKKKKLLLILIIFLCCLISVGYLYVMQNVIVDAKVKLSQAKWKVKFTDVVTTTVIGNAQNYRTPSLTDSFISLYPFFKEPGDSISYRIKVSNVGNLKAAINSIDVVSNLIDIVDFEYNNLNIGDTLEAGESKYFDVKFSYNPQQNVSTKEDKIVLVVNWKQAV